MICELSLKFFFPPVVNSIYFGDKNSCPFLSVAGHYKSNSDGNFFLLRIFLRLIAMSRFMPFDFGSRTPKPAGCLPDWLDNSVLLLPLSL